MKRIILTLFALEVVTLATMSAQTPTGAAAGLVTDPSGAAIAGAHVIVTSKQTGLKRAFVTAASGDYSAPARLPGEYEVSVEASGLSAARAGSPGRSRPHYNPGLGHADWVAAKAVIVNGASLQIRYDAHEVGGVVTCAQIEDVPLNGRVHRKF